MTKDRLEQFCKDHGIFVPTGATKEYLEAAIVRAYGNEKTLLMFSKECFGAWEQDNSECKVCDYEAQCFKTSIGMSKEEYFKKLESAENPRLRFKDSMRTKNSRSRFSRRTRKGE